MGPVSALVMGLLGSAHCVAMCGGVVGVLCAGMPVQIRTRPVRQLPITLGYNFGRVASYSIAGLVAGTFGASASDLVPVHIGQIALKALAALLMLGVGLYLAGWWPAFARVEKLGAPLWRYVQPLARRLLPVRSPWQAVGLGLMWGWMPCGLVYAALALAMGAGSGAAGALTMAAFGLGTLPTLLAMGTLAGSVSRAAKKPVFRRSAGVLLGAFGIMSLIVVSRQVDGAMHASVAGESHVHCHCH